MKPSTELLNHIVERASGWDAALLDAEGQIAEAEKRAARLRATASIIKRMISAGEPWPGQSSTDPTGD
jgi:hypothetical protein